jgi:hypothetical protein
MSKANINWALQARERATGVWRSTRDPMAAMRYQRGLVVVGQGRLARPTPSTVLDVSPLAPGENLEGEGGSRGLRGGSFQTHPRFATTLIFPHNRALTSNGPYRGCPSAIEPMKRRPVCNSALWIPEDLEAFPDRCKLPEQHPTRLREFNFASPTGCRAVIGRLLICLPSFCVNADLMIRGLSLLRNPQHP